MPEPLTHSAAGATAAGIAVVPTAAAVSGLFDIEYLAISWAFIGGVVYLITLERMNSWAMACLSIFVSTALGNGFGHWLAKPAVILLMHFMPMLQPWEPEGLHPIMGFISLSVDIFGQRALPAPANLIFRMPCILSMAQCLAGHQAGSLFGSKLTKLGQSLGLSRCISDIVNLARLPSNPLENERRAHRIGRTGKRPT